jgi:hypothetical protein
MTKCIIEDCLESAFSRGHCKKCYARARRSGALAVDPMRAHGSPEERFWRRVQKTDGCWLWTGGTYSGGYGFMRGARGRNAQNVSAHRFSYELHKGKIPKGLVVMHSCDNPACVNPNHLSVGTHKENYEDMIAKGRGADNPPPRGKGARNGNSLLTEDKVRYIRASTASHAALGRELGVTDVCIHKVRKRHTWSHVE